MVNPTTIGVGPITFDPDPTDPPPDPKTPTDPPWSGCPCASDAPPDQRQQERRRQLQQGPELEPRGQQPGVELDEPRLRRLRSALDKHVDKLLAEGAADEEVETARAHRDAWVGRVCRRGVDALGGEAGADGEEQQPWCA